EVEDRVAETWIGHEPAQDLLLGKAQQRIDIVGGAESLAAPPQPGRLLDPPAPAPRRLRGEWPGPGRRPAVAPLHPVPHGRRAVRRRFSRPKCRSQQNNKEDDLQPTWRACRSRKDLQRRLLPRETKR